MKKFFVYTIIACILFLPVTAQANVMDIDKKIAKTIEAFGIDVESSFLGELEPINITTFDEYSKSEKSNRNNSSWSTIWNFNVDKTEIKYQFSSALKGYPADNLLDQRIDTAWVEGANDNGTGEWVSIELTPKQNAKECPVGIFYFGMIPGYSKSDSTWEENNRIKSALLVIKKYSKDNKPLYEYAIIRLKFKDIRKLHVFNISDYDDEPVTERKIWLIIEDVYKGTKYNDTCISEMTISGCIANPGTK